MGVERAILDAEAVGVEPRTIADIQFEQVV